MTTFLRFIVCLVLLGPLSAGAAKYCVDSSPDGIKLETSAKRMVSVTRTPVKFDDSSGRRKARVIAQERAKGEIVRFFEQNQTSIRTIKSTDEDSETATAITDQNGRKSSKSYTREQSDTLVEMETSIAAGDLSGILQVEEHFDESTQEMCVAMGFSAKSAQAAQDAQKWMQGETPQSSPEADTAGDEASDGTSTYTRSIDDNW
jgi:hypothetical protein